MHKNFFTPIPVTARILVLALLIPLAAAAQDAAGLRDLYPGDGRFEGWALKDSVKVYVPDYLYVHVGEASGLYLEYGTLLSSEALYTDPAAARIVLEVFEMNRPEGAWGIFTMNSSGQGKEVEVGDIALQYDHYIHLVKGNYYIRCTSSSRDEEHMQFVMAFCSWVSDKIPVHAKRPPIMQAFEFDDLGVDSEKYFMGQVGLNEVFDFGHGTFAGFSEGASGRSSDKQFFVLSYANERTRREWFASARGKVKMSQNQRFSDYRIEEDGFTALDRNGNMFAFRPFREFVLITRGFSWREATGLMDEMAERLGNAVR